jgi:hypothetical protein
MDELAREKILVQSHLRRLICTHPAPPPYRMWLAGRSCVV